MLRLIPNAKVATGMGCYRLECLIHPGDLLGEATPGTLCHLPAKPLTDVKAAKISPLLHCTVEKIMLYLPCAATGSNPNWPMTWKLN